MNIMSDNKFMITQIDSLGKIEAMIIVYYLRKGELHIMWIYSKYITVKGRRIYRKDGGVFRFWVDEDKIR